MLEVITAWFIRAVMFATVMLYGSMGEILTEKSGHLNLGIPGIMFVGGFMGFAAVHYYEIAAGEAYIPIVCVIIGLTCAFAAAALVGLLYSFLTISLKANQNVTGLTITIFGVGLGKFCGTIVMGQSTVSSAAKAFATFSTKIPFVSELPVVGGLFFSYGFMVYLAVIMAIAVNYLLRRTRTGLNLRAIGENPGTADAAGVNVSKYKYLASTIGAGIAGLGGLYYVLEYNKGMWATSNSIEALGWLAVALVIFSTWNSIHAIWGSVLFGLLSWAYAFLPKLGVPIPSTAVPLVQMLPYVVTLLVLIVISLRKKKENQPPGSLGLSYFREER